MTLDTIYHDTFDTREELLEAVNKYLVQRNYGGAVICKSGESKGTEYCYIKCIQGGDYKPHRAASKKVEAVINATDGDNVSAAIEGQVFDPETQFVCANGVVKSKPETKTIRVGCPYVIYASKGKHSTKWVMKPQGKSSHLKHTCRANEDEPTDLRIFHRVRKADMTREATTDAVHQAAIGMTPAQIMRLMRSQNPATRVIPADIRRALANSNVEQHRGGNQFLSIERMLRTGRYTYRYDLTEEGQLSRLFVAHEHSISQAQRFPEVVIIDATYKTNIAGVPLVHIVGVDNLASDKSTDSLRTFFIAYALVINEKKDSYTWLMKCLQSVIYDVANGPYVPGLFVTDNDASLRSAIKEVFPAVPRSLCSWHIRMNFETRLDNCINGDIRERFVSAVVSLLYARSIDDFEVSKSRYFGAISGMPNKDALSIYFAR